MVLHIDAAELVMGLWPDKFITNQKLKIRNALNTIMY